MKLAVIGMAPKSTECWNSLFHVLDEGEAEGMITYTVIDYFDAVEDDIKTYHGAIYLDHDPLTEEIPFYTLKDCEFNDSDFFDFIDTVEQYLEHVKPHEDMKAELNQEPYVPEVKDSKIIPIDDLVYEITEDEVKKFVFSAITVVINGKEVKLSPSDFVTLGKMCRIIDRYGYKVKNVVV